MGFTPDQIAECRDLFSIFDKDSDGVISRDEFGPMMKTLGLHLNERELGKYFNGMDFNGDGMIEFDELVEFLQMIARPISMEDELCQAFKYFQPHANDETFITKRSLAAVLTSMGEEISEAECADMIATVTGGGETIDFEVFQRLCKPRKQLGTGHRARFE